MTNLTRGFRPILTPSYFLMWLLLASCGGPDVRRAPRPPITVAAVERRSVPYELEASGTVEPVASAEVTAQVGGIVVAVPLREGADVRAGQPLVQIDPRPLEANVAEAQAVLARDRARARSANLELDRSETLARQQLLAAGELDDKRANAEAFAASILADSAALVKARLDLAYATLRAPINGRAGSTRVHVGDVLRPNDPANPVVTLHQLRPIRVRFTVPQASLPEIRGERRSNVTVRVAASSTDSVWSTGRLVFVDNQIEAATGTVLLKGEFPNHDGALWPGAFVTVRLRLSEQADALVVPLRAVTNSQQGPFCYVVQPDTTVEMRPVGVARSYDGYAVITRGLAAGEIVVTDGQVRLSPGARASIRDPKAATSAGGSGAAGRDGPERKR